MLKLADIEQPHNLEAERALLGSLMLDSDLFSTISGKISRDGFYNTTHQYIFESIAELFLHQKPIDTISIMQQIKALGHDVELSYLANLPDTVPLSSNIQYYADIVEEYAKKRAVMRLAVEMINMAGVPTSSAKETIESSMQSLYDLAKEEQTTRLYTIKEAVESAFDDIEHRFNERLENPDDEITYGMPSGFIDLDEVTGGFAPSELTILAARPSMGKTALGLNIAYNSAKKQGKPVAIFSIEMSKELLAIRLLSMESGVSAHRLKIANLTDEDFTRLGRAQGLLVETPILIDDSSAITTFHIRNELRKFNMTHPDNEIGMVMVDYMQLMSAPSSSGRDEQRYETIGKISRGLKALAREFNIPIIALSQLSRAVEGRKDNMPILSDLRESGSIEQDADLVLFIHREDYYNKDIEDSKRNTASIIVAKNRNGPTEKVSLFFDRELTRFGNMIKEDKPF